MFFAALVLHAQFVTGWRAQDVLAAVVAADDVGMFRVMEGVGNIRAVRVAAVKGNANFGALNQRRVKAVISSGVGICQPHPQIAVAGFAEQAVNVQLHPVESRLVEMGVHIIGVAAFNPRRMRRTTAADSCSSAARSFAPGRTPPVLQFPSDNPATAFKAVSPRPDRGLTFRLPATDFPAASAPHQ